MKQSRLLKMRRTEQAKTEELHWLEIVSLSNPVLEIKDRGYWIEDMNNGNVDKRNLPKKFKPLPYIFMLYIWRFTFHKYFRTDWLNWNCPSSGERQTGKDSRLHWLSQHSADDRIGHSLCRSSSSHHGQVPHFKGVLHPRVSGLLLPWLRHWNRGLYYSFCGEVASF